MSENPTQDIKLVLRANDENTNLDPQRYNLPTGTDIAVILPMERQTTLERDVVVCKSAANHPDGKHTMNIKSLHPMYDPLMYVLKFPFGDKRWEKDYKAGNKVYTAQEYYKYRLMIYGDTFNTIHRMGRLFQTVCCRHVYQNRRWQAEIHNRKPKQDKSRVISRIGWCNSKFRWHNRWISDWQEDNPSINLHWKC